MTIREVLTTGGREFVAASCSRCFRKGKPTFRVRVDDPTPEEIERVRFKANRHDGRKANHPITLYINRTR